MKSPDFVVLEARLFLAYQKKEYGKHELSFRQWTDKAHSLSRYGQVHKKIKYETDDYFGHNYQFRNEFLLPKRQLE
jgi:hypothetical protein